MSSMTKELVVKRTFPARIANMGTMGALRVRKRLLVALQTSQVRNRPPVAPQILRGRKRRPIALQIPNRRPAASQMPQVRNPHLAAPPTPLPAISQA